MSANLVMTEKGLALEAEGQMIIGDFARLLARTAPHNLGGELVVKAAKVKSLGENPWVIDATAGMGEDAFLLAAAGCKVTMYERDAVIAALLNDALLRAAKDERLKEIAGRMTLIEGDSVEGMGTFAERPDVILLDPMFPERKKSGLVKKKFQIIHVLERPCEDEEELLEAAIKAGPKKIIIKRPAKGPYLAGRKPSYSITGKAVRYDCIVL